MGRLKRLIAPPSELRRLRQRVEELESERAAEAELAKLEHDWQIRYDRLWDEAEAIRLERDEWRDTAQSEMAGRRAAEAKLAKVVEAGDAIVAITSPLSLVAAPLVKAWVAAKGE